MLLKIFEKITECYFCLLNLDEIKVLEDEQKISREVDAKVNNNGETRLHLAAKTDSYDMLKKLIEKVCFQIDISGLRLE